MNFNEFCDVADQISASLGYKSNRQQVRQWYKSFKGGNAEAYIRACLENRENRMSLREKILDLAENNETARIWSGRTSKEYIIRKHSESSVAFVCEDGAIPSVDYLLLFYDEIELKGNKFILKP